MTVPVRDDRDYHLGLVATAAGVGYVPVEWQPSPPSTYLYGVFKLLPYIRAGVETSRWVSVTQMHPWDLDPYMNYEPTGYRKMTEGDL